MTGTSGAGAHHDAHQPASPAIAAPADLAGRTIVVTGAGAGIGRACAVALAAAGAHVLLLGRRVAPLEHCYDAIMAQVGAREPWIVPFDLAQPHGPGWAELIDRFRQEFAALDGLVHCAGVLGPRAPIELTDPQAWRDTFAINVHGAFELTRGLLPLLRESGDASIVFSSSSVGRAGRAYWGAYAASKFAVEGLAQVLADELRATTAIRVNVVNPGATRTGMRARAYPGEDPQTVAPPSERVPLYLWLCSAAARGVTGQRFDAIGWRMPTVAG